MNYKYKVCLNGVDVRWSYGDSFTGTYIDNGEAAVFFAQQVKRSSPEEVVTILVLEKKD